MNKKGFTLVELLAVIIVLAILVLLALPRVMSLMERSRVSSFAVEANEIAKAATNAYGSRVLTEEEVGHPVCFTVAELVNGGYLDAEKNDVSGAIAIDLVPDENDLSKTNEIVYTYLSKENYYVKKNGVAGNNKVANSDVVKSKGSPLFSDCTTTCSATTGGEAIMCGDTNITEIVASSEEDLGNCEFELGHAWNFDYKGSIDEFSIPCNGNYRLEVWGAQGGSFSEAYHGGYGGYATGIIRLTTTDKLYIGVGGAGTHVGSNQTRNGGYNGGGSLLSYWSDGNERRSTGGGATHIAKNNDLGILKNYVNNQSDILIVAGGGGGGQANNVMINSSSYKGGFGIGGSGGGTNGGKAQGQQYEELLAAAGGTQTSAPSGAGFGYGGSTISNDGNATGAGGGWYGGQGFYRGAGGGSGYLSNSLSNSHMACFDCMEADDNVTTNINIVSTDASADTAKQGNGYAKITYLGNRVSNVEKTIYQFNYSGTTKEFTIPKTGTYKIEAWGAQGGSCIDPYLGGYGGYSVGNMSLTAGQKIYITVGGSGSCGTGVMPGGYNGGGIGTGGNCNNNIRNGASGGGASHVATSSGELSGLENNKNAIIMVAGGGGGAHKMGSAYGSGAAGGGYAGNTSNWTNSGHSYKVAPTGGSQTAGGLNGYSYSASERLEASFGLGNSWNTSACAEGSGGGGGYFGGGAGQFAPGGGGSGYINTTKLSSAKMVCYNCSASTDAATKTETSTCHNRVALQNCAKEGNGYVLITYLNN